MLSPRRLGRVRPTWLLALTVAIIPFASGLTGSRVFYIRDLSMFFWGQHLFLRRELLSGHFPLWDPWVGGAQSSITDALRQTFLLPAVAVRLIGSEAFGFNLWVLTPFPLAALGTWLFFRRRFSPSASVLGAIAFAVSGPIVSTANFPNMSWSVAGMPWLFWTVDRLAAEPTLRAMVVVALATAFQALAGEPVTLLTTLALVTTYTFIVAAPATDRTLRRQARRVAATGAAIALGLGLAAVQLVPLAHAARGSERSGTVANDFWSLHPLALLETVSLHLFGDYYSAQHLQQVPWLPLVNSGREPFLFSLYFGVPLLALALFGLIASGPRWRLFWILGGAASLIGAFGSHTPIYPFVRDHVPLLAAFRFPAKYMVVSSLVVAAGAAAGWDALDIGRDEVLRFRVRAALPTSLGATILVGVVAAVVAAAAIYFPAPTAFRSYQAARALGAADPVAAAQFMFKTLPGHASVVLLLAAASALLLWLAASRREESAAARWLLGGLIVADLVAHAWGMNPTFDRAWVAEPDWLAYTRSDPDRRIYVGGKREGTLDSTDLDGSGPIRNPPGLVGSASRAALNGELNFEASAWRTREMLSYDLPILWPRRFAATTKRFDDATRADRNRLLDRTGVRYRILPRAQASGHAPVIQVPYLFDSYLYDWGDGISRRVSVVSEAKVVAADQQIAALFEDGWDAKALALIERMPTAEGDPGAPAATGTASILDDRSNRVIVKASAVAGGGYLVMLDSYSDDWRVRVDGHDASMVLANGLFRAVRLVAGPHTVEFVYWPRDFVVGLAISSGS